MGIKDLTFQKIASTIKQGASNIKANWEVQAETKRQEALKEKAYRDEADAIYKGAYETEKLKQIKELAQKKARFEAKLRAKSMFAPKPQHNPLFATNKAMNVLIGDGFFPKAKPKAQPSQTQTTLKDNLKKEIPNKKLNDMIWKL